MKKMKNASLFVLATLTMFSSCSGHKPEAGEIEMVTVEGGTTTINGTEVTISSFQIGKYEVTQKLWWDVMGKWTRATPTTAAGKGDNYPMYYVSYDDVQMFLIKLNSLTGMSYRLPTEAEWEYAAKGGQQTHNYDYSGSNTLSDVAWYYANAYVQGESNPGYGTHAVGTKLPNELGIYDMSGNVTEWCNDWYGTAYPSSTDNPTGATSGEARVFHGGCWYTVESGNRMSLRVINSPGFSSDAIGFRLVLPL
jgi:formylglycine-generating enzyme required for sulfatase activity